MDTEALTATLNLVNTFGVTAVLFIFLRLFITGAILPRAVYDDITEKIVGDIVARILAGARDIVDDAINKTGADE